MKLRQDIEIKDRASQAIYLYKGPVFDFEMNCFHLLHRPEFFLTFIVPDKQLTKDFENV